MARNKYPEETVEKILTAARRLFLEKGYEQTTIQDIVDQLGGLTKGAIYHHFKSKEEIMFALSEQMFVQRNPFEAVRERTDLNAVEKLREVIRLTQAPDWAQLNRESIPLLKNPRILAENIQSSREMALPLFMELMEEGLRPALVVGVPVGFVNVEESKEILFAACEARGVPAIAAMGRKGGSNVAAAICNALLYAATETLDPAARGWQ